MDINGAISAAETRVAVAVVRSRLSHHYHRRWLLEKMAAMIFEVAGGGGEGDVWPSK
jgi:hypothetical protein